MPGPKSSKLKGSDKDLAEWAWAEALKKASGAESVRAYRTPFGGYKDDLVGFGKDILGHRYWAAQEAIMRALMKYQRVVVRSARKTGKTYQAADTALGFLNTAPSIVITTAPTVRQVRELIWSRIRSAHARARTRLPGVPGIQSLRIDHDWYALGVATSDPDNVLGFHAGIDFDGEEDDKVGALVTKESIFDTMVRAKSSDPAHRLLIIFDEAPGIQQAIFDALEGSMSGQNVYALMQGNPRLSQDAGHSFARAFVKDSGWWRIHVGAEEPKEDPVESDQCFHSVPEGFMPKKWIEERRREWGEDSALFQSDVLGLFTNAAVERQIIPLWVLEAACRYDIIDDDRASSRHIGCDISGGESAGRDWCIATLWINGALSALHRWKSPDTMTTLGMLEALLTKWAPDGQMIPARNLHIDATGVGKGVIDRLRQKGLYVDAVDFGSRARYDWRGMCGEMKFRDRKSELYWVMRRALQEGVAMIPRKYSDVWRQLQWHSYKQIQRQDGSALAIEETKDVLRQRYGRSPDEADASVVAWSRSAGRPSFMLVSTGTTISGH